MKNDNEDLKKIKKNIVIDAVISAILTILAIFCIGIFVTSSLLAATLGYVVAFIGTFRIMVKNIKELKRDQGK